MELPMIQTRVNYTVRAVHIRGNAKDRDANSRAFGVVGVRKRTAGNGSRRATS
jgi:hypothetical protein